MKKISVTAFMVLCLSFTGCGIAEEVEKNVAKVTSEIEVGGAKVASEIEESGASLADGGDIEDAIDISIGQVITAEETCEIQVENVQFSSKVEPSYPVEDEYYYYYEATADTNTLLDIKCNVKNLSTTAKSESDFYNIYAMYDGKYEYMGAQIHELADGSDLEDYVTVQPLETVILHTIIEVPLEVAESDKPLDIYFEIGDDVYRLKVK